MNRYDVLGILLAGLMLATSYVLIHAPELVYEWIMRSLEAVVWKSVDMATNVKSARDVAIRTAGVGWIFRHAILRGVKWVVGYRGQHDRD